MSLPSIKLRVLKTWVSSDCSLIFQVQPLAPPAFGSLPKKVHLSLDLKQQSFGARLAIDKPGDASANHAFIQILRKHCPSFTIKSILSEEATGHLWIDLLAGQDHDSQPWRLRLLKDKPPLVSLVSPEQIIFVSFGQRGTFTKKHGLEPPLQPAPGAIDILPQLCTQLTRPAAEPNEDAAESGSLDPIPKAQRELRSRLQRKLKTLRKTLEKIETDLPAAANVEELERHATLLQSYAYLLKPEAVELRLDAVLTGLDHELSIPVNPDKSRGAQIDEAFHRLHRSRRGRELGLKQWQQIRDQMFNLEADIRFLQTQPRLDSELTHLIHRYKLPELQRSSPQNEGATARPFKTYKASTGHTFLVGKGAHENDELTKSARSNDYWLHAVGVTGSHVIIPVTADIRSALPLQLKREAAMLALHFSKVKEDKAGECYVTRKAQVKKAKGMPPGLWRILQSESFYLKYSEGELQALLETVKL